MIRIAILDLYDGQPNQGMRCIRSILNEWCNRQQLEVEWNEFNVRMFNEAPDLSYDIYVSSGGPGSPLESQGSEWEKAYFKWLSQIESWNSDPHNANKKFVFLICHSFELVCRHYGIAQITQRKSTSFGVFPVHLTEAGEKEQVFNGLSNPFYVVDSRDWQVIQVDQKKLKLIGAEVLCIEKERPYVPYERAIMGLRFNPYMIGTQFHPEADAEGMSLYLQTEEKKKNLIENYGEAKWQSMIDGLNDPEKIMWTYAHILPNFLNSCLEQLIPSVIKPWGID